MRKIEQKHGFTLMELLIVISILAVLAAILLPAMRGALRRADVATAVNDMNNIVGGIKSYYTEYGKWPMDRLQGDEDDDDEVFGSKTIASGNEQAEVMAILRGIDEPTYNPDYLNNPKKIAFVEVPQKSMEGTDKDGNTYVQDDGYYLDPWENPYIIIMDRDFDGEIGGFDWALGEPQQSYISALSPDNNGTFPGVTIGVMSYGEDPSDEEAFLISW
jgi:prepilin-type N-terminal cleavage/methylation domain-containing protein